MNSKIKDNNYRCELPSMRIIHVHMCTHQITVKILLQAHCSLLYDIHIFWF